MQDQHGRADGDKTSLIGQIWRVASRGAVRGAARAGLARDLNPDVIAPGSAPVTPLPLVHAIEALSAACGKPASRAHLTAALPVAGADMDRRYAPFALARVGLDARWESQAPSALRAEDLPALIALNMGGALIVTSLDKAGSRACILDGEGERNLPLAMLDSLAAGEVLICGHIDPENGLDAEEERTLLQRNPKLWLLGAFMAQRGKVGQLMVAALLINMCALAIPLYMRAIYDRVVPNLAIESLWALSAGVVLVLLFELVCRQLRAAFVDSVGVRVGQVVQHRAMSALLHARMNHDSNSVGTLMTGLRDVEQLVMLAPQAAVTFLVDLPCFFAFLALILLIGGWAVAGPVMAAAAMLLVGVIANYALKLAGRRSSRLMQARNNLVVEVTEGWQTIKANQAEGRFLRQWDLVADHIAVSTQATRKWSEMPGAASGLLVQLALVLVIIIGVFQIKAGMMTTGAMVALTMLTGRAMVPVSAVIGMVGKVYQCLSQFSSLCHILQMEPERATSDPAIRPGRVRGDIRLGNVTHRFEGASEASLKDISLAIEPGEKIALIGKSGSGKSTLLHLIAGLIVRQSGTVTVDGHAIDQYAVSQLRQSILYAGQDATLFDMSIWDNILLGMPEPDKALVEQAIRASGLDAFVSRTAEGYGRRVGPRGVHLSGGQRQSLVLARALVRDPSVLLLDEPTAAMDINSEQLVINGLREAAQDKTVLIATHRLALLDIVDRVVWLEEGRIVADKPRTEVLAMLRNANAARATGQAA